MSEVLRKHGLVPYAEMRGELAHAAKGIPLRKRDGAIKAFAMVDAGDYARLGSLRWYEKSRYVRRNRPAPDRASGQTTVQLHREILGLEHGDPLKVDHVNHDTLDNRRTNLRLCTHAENHQNRRPDRDSSSRHRGVSWRKELSKWHAYAWLGGRHYHLGYFVDEDEAGRVAAEFRRQHMPFTTN